MMKLKSKNIYIRKKRLENTFIFTWKNWKQKYKLVYLNPQNCEESTHVVKKV